MARLLLLALFFTTACTIADAAPSRRLLEESDGATAPSCPSEVTYAAGYKTLPVTKDKPVCEHAKIDLDIKAIEDEMKLQKDAAAGTAYTKAKAIYTGGKNSKKGTGFRTLSGFTYKTGEPFGKLFDDWKASNGSIDAHEAIVAALDGADSAKYGAFKTGSVASKYDYRSQVIKKNLKFQVLMLYALHEVEAAVAKYKTKKPEADYQYALDEWWVFYTGSLETGATDGYGSYILAEKRSKFFGTDNAPGKCAKSMVNHKLLKASQELQTLFATQSPANDAKIDTTVTCMRGLLIVPLIQGCIQYGYKTDTSTAYPGKNSAARKGELYSFCQGVLPFLHAANPAAAATLKAEIDIVGNDAKNPSFATIKGVFTAANLNKMGVSCKDIGAFVDKSADKTSATTLGSDFTMCTDGTISNADADTSKCDAKFAKGTSTCSSSSSDAGRISMSLAGIFSSFLLSLSLARVAGAA